MTDENPPESGDQQEPVEVSGFDDLFVRPWAMHSEQSNRKKQLLPGSRATRTIYFYERHKHLTPQKACMKWISEAEETLGRKMTFEESLEQIESWRGTGKDISLGRVETHRF